MAYEINDLKGILFLVFAIPMIASTNIDCSGKAFHCINSTHFMICVDLGGGVSTTIDDFIIPCPPTTECHEHNIFECEFPKTIFTTSSPLEVIGVSKQSDISATISVINSVAVPTPPDKSLIELNENNTVTTVAIPEEVTSVKNLDVVKNVNQPNENTMATKHINIKPTNNYTNRNASATDNNIKLDSAVQHLADKASDKSKSIDNNDNVTTVASTIKHYELIANDSQRPHQTDILNNSTSLVDHKITEQPLKHINVNDIVVDEMTTTPLVNIWNGSDGMSKTDNNDQNNSITESNAIGEITTTEKIYFSPSVLVNQTTDNYATLGFDDLFLDDNATNQSTSDTFLNSSHDNTNTSEQYTTTQATINTETIKHVSGLKPDILREISTNTDVIVNLENIHENSVKHQNDIFNHRNLVEQIPLAEVNKTDQIPERIISPGKNENSILTSETLISSQTTLGEVLGNIVYSTTAKNNDSFVEDVTDTPSLKIMVTTDLTIKFTDNSYQMKPESNRAFIATKYNTSDTNKMIEMIQPVYNTSSTNMFNNITTELNTFLTSTTIYPSTEISTPQKTTVNGIGYEVLSATTATSVNETPLNIYTTPDPYNAIFSPVTNTTIGDWLPQNDIFSIVSKDTDIVSDRISEIIVHTTSENYSFSDQSVTISNQDSNNQVKVNHLNDFTSVKRHENLNQTNTVYGVDLSKLGMLNNSFNPIKTNKNLTIPETIDITTISLDSVSKVTKNNMKITGESLSANEVSTKIPETIYTTKISLNSLPKALKHNLKIAGESLSANEVTTNIPETIYTTTIISTDSVSKVPKHNLKILDESLSANEVTTNIPETIYTTTIISTDSVSKVPKHNLKIAGESLSANEVTTNIPETIYTTTIISTDSVSKVPKHNLEILDESLSANKVTTNIPETIYTTTIGLDSVSKVPKHNLKITDGSIAAKDYKVETTTWAPQGVTNSNNKESYENILMTTATQARELIIQKVNTDKQMNTNVVPNESFTDIVSSTISTIYAKKSNWNDTANIETTTSAIDQTKIANTLRTITLNNTIISDRTTSLSSASNTYNDENVKITPVIETTHSVIDSISNEALRPLNLITVLPLNSTKNNVINISLSADYIKTSKLENTSLNASVTNYSSGNNFTKDTKSASKQSESLPKNIQTTVSFLQENHMYLESSKPSTQSLLTIEKNSESVTTVTSTDSPLQTVGFYQRYQTTNSMNYVTEKVLNFNSSEEPTSTKQGSLPYVEIKATNPVSVPDTITKTTAYISSSTHIDLPQGIKDNLEERKGQPVFTTVTETQTKTYDNRKSLLQPVLDATRQNYTIPQVTTAPIYRDISKIETSAVSPKPIFNYNFPQSMINTTIVKRATITTNTDTLNNNNNIPKLGDKSVKHIIDHENIVMDNNTFQDNTKNTTIMIKELLDSNKEKVNFTENDWTPMDVNIESTQKIAFKINDFSFEEEAMNASTGSKNTDILNKSMPSDGLATQIDYKYLKQTDFVGATSPLYVIETGSAAPKYLTESKKIKTYIDKLLQNNKTEVNSTKQDEDSKTISIKINGTDSNLNDDEQANELKSSGNSLRNPNITTTSTKSNLYSTYNPIINGSASLFNCLNHTRGRYADKKDCRKFYTCVGKLQPIIGTCPNNTVFSEINKQCTRNLSHCVRNNQFHCLLEGRFSDFFLDNIYYICVKNSTNHFVRYTLQCQTGYHINKVLVKCEKDEDFPSQSVSSASENSKINNDESKTNIQIEETMKTNRTADFECTSEGTFPYEKNCRKYYVCTNVKNIYRRKIKKCSSDEVFDSKKNKCIENESAEC